MLLSWAVPKGPSLDPKTKRLAMHVEDHPLEYGEFEGVIPEGYGAGIVMLWDRGTWTPEVDDVDAALKKGDLKFTLDGYKLKGSWVLVRTERPLSGRARRIATTAQLAADQAPRRLGRRPRHHRVRAAQREERRRLRGHPRPRTRRPSGSRTARPRAATPARCSRTIIERAAKLKAERARQLDTTTRQPLDRRRPRSARAKADHDRDSHKDAETAEDFVSSVSFAEASSTS